MLDQESEPRYNSLICTWTKFMPTKMEERSSEKHGSAAELGKYLANLRHSKGLTLRQVEEATEKIVSNAYLSQLENGYIAKPSAQILYSLAALYGVPYESLMEKAGYLAPAAIQKEEGERHGRTATLPIEDLSEEEEKQLLEFLSYLRFKRKKK